MMKFTPLSLSGLMLIEPQVFGDDRGFYGNIFQKEFTQNGINIDFVQDNHSRSGNGVLVPSLPKPLAQAKLIGKHGEVLDVAVDIRPDSSTFGKWIQPIFQPKIKMLFIPVGFAHGFYCLTEIVDFNTNAALSMIKSPKAVFMERPRCQCWLVGSVSCSLRKDKLLPSFKSQIKDLKNLSGNFYKLYVILDT